MPQHTSIKTLFSSISAIDFPKHRHLPGEKRISAVLSTIINLSSSASSHLSGRKLLASSPQMVLIPENTPSTVCDFSFDRDKLLVYKIAAFGSFLGNQPSYKWPDT
jgi:hypothetical protein